MHAENRRSAKIKEKRGESIRRINEGNPLFRGNKTPESMEETRGGNSSKTTRDKRRSFKSERKRIGIIYEKDETAFQTTIFFFFLSFLPRSTRSGHEVFRCRSGDSVNVSLVSLFFPFFHLSIIVTPWRIPRSLAAG